MNSARILAAMVGALVAVISFGDVIKNPDTKGWGVGLGALAFIGFGLWAIAS